MSFKPTPTLACLAALVLLGACSSTGTPGTAARNDGPTTCRAEAVPGMLGKPATAERVERARDQTGARRVRVLAPGDAVTLDHDPQRLNIEIDEAETIQRIRCG
ncbi:I78 family peptidase inhibitor [Pseudomonas benzenivorans]|uniref:I78 family peptidase inhibitor n=1 Tax=Pseudomonas benzenivorans TaxID=556533 RepID=A0ABZ0PY81_9PSED|nr:I78 family peptidase inhibitor [Pseudomonas benzenivorans]WPC06119.1 I78 family peptidase inhibitor [Pseudomonas benzenivorans]